MESIRIKNLHCISDTKDIPLKSINLFVGANSSGKSSILRLFPLLKQGLEVKKRGPLLWYGEDVDFGSFKNTCKQGENNIQLEFRVILQESDMKYRLYSPYRIENLATGEYRVSVKIESKDNIDYISELRILFKDQKIQITFNEHNALAKIKINDVDYSSLREEMAVFSFNSLLPRLEFAKKIDENRYSFAGAYLSKSLRAVIQDHCTPKVSSETITKIAFSIGVGSKTDILNSAKSQKKIISWAKTVNRWSVDSSDFIKFNNDMLFQYIPRLIYLIDNGLNDYIRNIHYIGPFRATAQRYYRKQNLSISEIDSQGFNLPMFIDNLLPHQQRDFKDWMIDKFNFYIESSSSEGHISLMLVDADSQEKFNLADRGFGFSQLLPIITMLWTLENSTHRRSIYRCIIFAIEQPELHLHPMLQAKLIDAFISSIRLFKDKNIDIKLILETHSSIIVNRIGLKIAEQDFSADNVTIALFNGANSEEQVALANYNSLGYLQNWPIGFFDFQSL